MMLQGRAVKMLSLSNEESGGTVRSSTCGHHPTLRQRQNVVVQRVPWPACHTAPRTRCWFFLDESRKARMPLASKPIKVRHDPCLCFLDLR